MKLLKIIVSLLVVSVPVFMSAQTIDLGDIDIHAVTYCKKTELFCQIEREKTKLLVQALLMQVLEAQQASAVKDEQLDVYRVQLQDNPLQPDRSRSFDVVQGVVEINQDEHAVYQEIVKIFTKIIPKKYLKDFNQIVFLNDKDKGFSALVEQEVSKHGSMESEQWVLRINLYDVRLDSKKEYQETVGTMAHEVGHVLSLNHGQLDYFVNSDDCSNFYVADMKSCAEDGSYFEALAVYWSAHMNWFAKYAALTEANPSQAEDALVEYYQANKDEFISEYAATSYHEDLAETMAHFATDVLPIGELTLAEEKIIELYQFPEMLAFRKNVQSLLP